MTLDGRIATARRRLEVDHQLRAAARRRAGCVACTTPWLVGIGTVLADDPLLLPAPRTRRPFTRVVFDSRLRLPLAEPARRSSASDDARRCVIVTSRDGARRRRRCEAPGVDVIAARAARGRACRSAWALRALWRARALEPDGRGRLEVLGRLPRRAAGRPGGALPRAAAPGRARRAGPPSAAPAPRRLSDAAPSHAPAARSSGAQHGVARPGRRRRASRSGTLLWPG
mgnify:CR=1 FL=1